MRDITGTECEILFVRDPDQQLSILIKPKLSICGNISPDWTFTTIDGVGFLFKNLDEIL